MPPPLSLRQAVELFHLVVCRALYANVGDKRLLAIKGGINLRFFFGSVRFSENIDFDVSKMAKSTLENRIDRLLKTPAVVGPLKSRGIIVGDISKPKQTETVQRWKLQLLLPDSGLEARTKLEFSRRKTLEAAHLDPVDSTIANAYSLPAFLATHYRVAEAIAQKIHALAERSETQPRDVFDLNVLFARPDAPTELAPAEEWIVAAAENASSLAFEDYLALVVAYLEPEHQEIYASKESWEAMQTDVVNRILGLS